MPNVSSITTVLPIRVPNELLERLDAMATRLGERRNDVGREALERGLAQLEVQHIKQKPSPNKRQTAKNTQPVESADPELKAFIYWVLESVRRYPDRDKGRVSIRSLWALYKHLAPKSMNIASFKVRLEDGQRAGLVKLADEDLVLLA